MHELFSTHFIQEPYLFVQSLSSYKAQKLITISNYFIMVTSGFILGYLVRHLKHRIKKTYLYKRRT